MRLNPTLLLLPIILMLSPVSFTWVAMVEGRNSLESSQLRILTKTPSPKKEKLNSSPDRVHVYPIYHGLNDRYMQGSTSTGSLISRVKCRGY